jgi:hypothetical protein
MTASNTSKLAMTDDKASIGAYPVFSITFGAIFCVFYLFVMNYGWQLFTYYPASGQWTLLNHPPVGTAGPAMKWYGYVATSAVVSAIAGLLAVLIPHDLLKRFWWPGLIWAVPILAMIVLAVLIVYVGD